jgi:cobalt-zinc-cadmium efflux system membrane fusion protein
MNKKHLIGIVIILGAGAVLGWSILKMEKGKVADAHDHGSHAGHAGHDDEHGAAGRVKLTPAQLQQSGIVVEEVGAAPIRTTVKLFGKIGPNEDRLAHVLPRYPGIVKKVNKRVGEKVAKGETLAIIESSESLQPYEVRSEIDGTVVEKDVTIGEVVPQEKRIFVIVDLSAVWVNLNVYRQDFSKMRLGQNVILDPGSGLPHVESQITYISPFGADSTQTMLARAEIPNPDGLLRPGLFIEGHAVLEEVEVDVAVKDAALQTLDDKTVVFVAEGDAFEARPVQLGRQGGGWVEITRGLLPGERYVAANSFILKADIGKAGAAHEH